MVGIILALVFRGIFILLGAALIANFSWVFYIFGLFLVYTAVEPGVHEPRGRGEERERADPAAAHARSPSPTTSTARSCAPTIDGKKIFTPMLIVFIALGTTDLVFALDSIPAIFGITQSPFIVFTANVFALMGLRQLYFLLGDLVERLGYLTTASRSSSPSSA